MILGHGAWGYRKPLISDGAVGMLGSPMPLQKRHAAVDAVPCLLTTMLKVGLTGEIDSCSPLPGCTSQAKNKLCCSLAVDTAGFRVFVEYCSGQRCTSELQLEQLLQPRNCLCLFAEGTGLPSGTILFAVEQWECGLVSLGGDVPLYSLLCIPPAFCFRSLVLDLSVS